MKSNNYILTGKTTSEQCDIEKTADLLKSISIYKYTLNGEIEVWEGFNHIYFFYYTGKKCDQILHYIKETVWKNFE